MLVFLFFLSSIASTIILTWKTEKFILEGKVVGKSGGFGGVGLLQLIICLQHIEIRLRSALHQRLLRGKISCRG